ESHDRADQACRSAAGSLLPAESSERRRLAIGCGFVIVAGLLTFIFLPSVVPPGPGVHTTILPGDLPTGSAVMALEPELRMIAGSGPGKAITLWKLPGGEVHATLAGHEQPAQSLDFSSDAKWLASGGQDRSVCIWDVTKGNERQRWTTPDGVLALKF